MTDQRKGLRGLQQNFLGYHGCMLLSGRSAESGERVHVTAMRYGYEYIGAVRPTL